MTYEENIIKKVRQPLSALMLDIVTKCCEAETSLTDAEIAKIIHKMIDNSDIAEDAYPGLGQKLHEAVDEYYISEEENKTTT